MIAIYAQKSSAVRAAKKTGLDYQIHEAVGGFTFETLAPGIACGDDEASGVDTAPEIEKEQPVAIEEMPAAVETQTEELIAEVQESVVEMKMDIFALPVLALPVLEEKVEAPEANIPPRPFAELPQNSDELFHAIRKIIRNYENPEELNNLLDLMGMSKNDFNALKPSQAAQDLTSLVERDRLAWDEDFGGVRKNAVAKSPKKPSGEKPVVETVRKSNIDKPCKVVWDIAFSMPGARRKDVIKACEDAGVAFYTARTQYQQWLQAIKSDPNEYKNFLQNKKA